MDFEEQMVLTYVPEAEWMTWEAAIFAASCRDVEAARQLEWSVSYETFYRVNYIFRIFLLAMSIIAIQVSYWMIPGFTTGQVILMLSSIPISLELVYIAERGDDG